MPQAPEDPLRDILGVALSGAKEAAATFWCQNCSKVQVPKDGTLCEQCALLVTKACSFCQKPGTHTRLMVSSPPATAPPAFICFECVEACNELAESQGLFQTTKYTKFQAESEFREVAAQSERFRQAIVKAQTEKAQEHAQHIKEIGWWEQIAHDLAQVIFSNVEVLQSSAAKHAYRQYVRFVEDGVPPSTDSRESPDSQTGGESSH